MKRIAILTSGGDAPGMNAAVRAAVRYGIGLGAEVYGIRRGYAGIMENDIFELDARAVGGIVRVGGTVLMSARSPEFCSEQGQEKALDILHGWGIEGLVVIGGDGSLRGAMSLAQHGFPVVGIPASIDNDIACTEMSLGVDTALDTILGALDRIKDTASAHQRLFVVEVMGREYGYLALASGIAGGAEMVVLPDTVLDRDAVVKSVKSAFFRGKPHFIIVAAEGASHKGKSISCELMEYIAQAGYDPRTTVLGHVQRGGSPTCYDRILGTRFGAAAIDCLFSGKTNVMVGIEGNKIITTPLLTVLSTKPKLNKELLDLIDPLAI